MNAEETLKTLIQFNLWRRVGDDAIAMPNPQEIGKAIDTACVLISQLIENQTEQPDSKVDAAPEQWRSQCLVARIQRDEAIAMLKATPDAKGWLPIKSATTDGTEIIVYCPQAHGLPHMASVCAYREDAGFCVDELREPTLWVPTPLTPTRSGP